MNAHRVVPVIVLASLTGGLLMGLLVTRKRWWLAGLAAPPALILWPPIAGDANRAWSGGDFTYEAVAVIIALENILGFYLALGVGIGLRALVRHLRASRAA